MQSYRIGVVILAVHCLSQMTTNYTLLTEEIKSHPWAVPKLLGMCMINRDLVSDFSLEVVCREVSDLYPFFTHSIAGLFAL